ncbi:hypothetical protein [Wenjunlia vitaminophila]|uniref:hypothetical protein n=1 Tax=Wenjunlia vitaminophila TaxID=76728 RepID=UPI0012FEBFFD|nr:hypothetical protein [Wenjunlia vitaminophila]
MPPPPGTGPLAEPPRRSGAWRTWLVVVAVVVVGVGLGFGAVRLMDRDDDGRDPAAAGSVSAAPSTGRGQQPSGEQGSRPTASSAAPSPSTGLPATAGDQARAVDELLEESADDRETVVNAVQAVDGCVSPRAVEAAADDLSAAAGRREDLVRRLDGLELDLVSGGAAAAAELRAAWSHSADADRAYAAWAATAADGGCAPGGAPHDADYYRGGSSSAKATKAKKSFVRLWNPIADEHGLEARSAYAL